MNYYELLNAMDRLPEKFIKLSDSKCNELFFLWSQTDKAFLTSRGVDGVFHRYGMMKMVVENPLPGEVYLCLMRPDYQNLEENGIIAAYKIRPVRQIKEIKNN